MVMHRVGLRACAAIGAGCREAVRGVATIDPTRAAIVRLGAEAAAELAALPDTPELEADDRAFIVAHRPAANKQPSPAVRQMHRLVERYRDEGGIEAAILELTIAEAYARCLADITAHPAGEPPKAR